MQYVVTKTTSMSFAVTADTPEAAEEAVNTGNAGDPMSRNTTINTQARPQQPGKP